MKTTLLLQGPIPSSLASRAGATLQRGTTVTPIFTATEAAAAATTAGDPTAPPSKEIGLWVFCTPGRGTALTGLDGGGGSGATGAGTVAAAAGPRTSVRGEKSAAGGVSGRRRQMCARFVRCDDARSIDVA